MKKISLSKLAILIGSFEIMRAHLCIHPRFCVCMQSQTTQSHLLLPTIERGEDIFGQLENFKNEYNEWVLPAQVGFQIEPSHVLYSVTTTRHLALERLMWFWHYALM